MSRPLDQLWREAEANPGTEVDIGRTVLCDACGDDFTDSPAIGGFIFSSYAYCPNCARRCLPEIEAFGEERFIKARCPRDQAFADFVRVYRGRHNTISVHRL